MKFRGRASELYEDPMKEWGWIRISMIATLVSRLAESV
jgi:hypothetical protein